MADKKYKLSFELSDGSVKAVEFTAPQGEKGDPGYTPVKDVDYFDGSPGAPGVGISDITIAEV